MPGVRPARHKRGRRVIALVISDLHLTLNAPVSRAEEDWLEAQARPLRQVRELQKEHGCPVLCCGDVFDRWNPPAELINFALRELPYMSAVPGQHDLPHHRYEDIQRSGYWTLVEAGKVKNLISGTPFHASDDLTVWGTPWGTPVVKPAPQLTGINVAVIHSYIWIKSCSYPGAPKEARASKWYDRLEGFNVACFGDNHKGFLIETDGLTILNCGAMMRRKSDEQDYQPMISLIWGDGGVTQSPFDVSEDELLTKAEAFDIICSGTQGFDDFMESLRTIGDASSDFVEAVLEELARRKVRADVRAAITKALETK